MFCFSCSRWSVTPGGSYDRPSGQTNFRWGLYLGERPMNHDTMILVSGATVRAGER